MINEDWIIVIHRKKGNCENMVVPVQTTVPSDRLAKSVTLIWTLLKYLL